MLNIRTKARQSVSDTRTCPFCRSDVKAEEVIVACGDCHVYHHHDCWLETMKCSVCRSTKMLVRDEDRETVARDSAKAQVTDNFDFRIAELEEAAHHDRYASRAKAEALLNEVSLIESSARRQALSKRVMDVLLRLGQFAEERADRRARRPANSVWTQRVRSERDRFIASTDESVENAAILNPAREMLIVSGLYILSLILILFVESMKIGRFAIKVSPLFFVSFSMQLLAYGKCCIFVGTEKQGRTRKRCLIGAGIFSIIAVVNLLFIMSIVSEVKY